MPAYFEIVSGTDGVLYFSLRAANHAVLLTSDAHPSKAAALDALELVRVYAPVYSQYQRDSSGDGRHQFSLMATAGVVLGRSPLHASSIDLDRNITAVMLNAGRALVRALLSTSSD